MASVTATVSVTEDTKLPSQKGFTISVNPEPVVLNAHANDDAVEWNIVASPGWEFTQNKQGKSVGIAIKDPNNKFTDQKSPGGNKRFHKWARDPANADQKDYRYTISVTNSENPATTLTWDPSIQNK